MSTQTIKVFNTKDLRMHVAHAISEHGPACDLNHVDVGLIESFEGLFKGTDFNGDVSQWDMHNAKCTSEMFMDTPFNGDVSRWRMPRLEDATRMFAGSPFNGNVADWNCAGLLRRYRFEGMFNGECFAQDLAPWRIAAVREDFQLVSIKALTRSTALWSAMSDKKPPSIPDGATLRQATASAYALLFGGADGVAMHLAKTAFGPMHFDVCCAAPKCPAGIQEDHYQWCQDLLRVGTGLGLDNEQLRELFAAQWPLRGLHADALVRNDLFGDDLFGDEPPMVQ